MSGREALTRLACIGRKAPQHAEDCLTCNVCESQACIAFALQIGKAAAGVVLIGAASFNSLMALGNTLTWFNVTWFLSRAVYVSSRAYTTALHT